MYRSHLTFDPSDRQYLARRARTVGSTPEEIGAARERLLEESLVLERLTKDDAKETAMTRVGHGLDASAPFIDETLSRCLILIDELRLQRRALPRTVDGRFRHVFERAGQFGDGVTEPVQLRVLSSDHL